MEGFARVSQAYHVSKTEKFFSKYCNNSEKIELQKKSFKGKVLKVERAIDPSLILWQNYGYSTRNRCFRKILSVLIAFGMICLAVIALAYLKKQQSLIENTNNSFTVCNPEY
jgi:hypothetical protein